MIINPYIFLPEDRAINGYLYNWYAASDANFAPTDWKVPEDTDLDTLDTYLTTNYSGSEGYVIRDTGTTYWDNSSGTNLTGFKAYGSGARSDDGSFLQIKQRFEIWASTEAPITTKGYKASIFYTSSSFGWSQTELKERGYSIRLLYTGAGTPSTVTDNDGNVYDVVLIGTQRWTVQNWKCTTLDNGTSIPNVTDGTTWAGLTTLARCAYDNLESNV